MKIRQGMGWLAILVMTACLARALAPHEVLLLVNDASAASRDLANHYAYLRGIPGRNVVTLRLPVEVVKPPYRMMRTEFHRLIIEPVRALAHQRQVDRHVKAWVYSADFPLRIQMESGTDLSLTGATLLGDGHVSVKAVDRGTWISPYYRGPDATNLFLQPSASFGPTYDSACKGVPSMMLAFTGNRGLSLAEARIVLQRGVASDSTFPTGDVYFICTSDHVRSRPREWQYPIVRKALHERGIHSILAADFPQGEARLLGLQTGMSTVQPALYGVYMKGCMAEHLTSFAAAFDEPDQTKCAQWLRAGAVATAGTVTEPRANWHKFPSAFFFLHYSSGCCVMESFYQSIRCPLQTLLLGEPLAAPWTKNVIVSLEMLQRDDGALRLSGVVLPPPKKAFQRMDFFLDGKRLDHPGGAPFITLEHVADGYHELRAVATLGRRVYAYATGIKGLVVNRQGRSVSMHDTPHGTVELGGTIKVRIEATGTPALLGLISREQLLAGETQTNALEVELDLQRLGRGELMLQGVAHYTDGCEVRGLPVPISIR